MLTHGPCAQAVEPGHGVGEAWGLDREPSHFRNWVTVDGSHGPTGEMGFRAGPRRYHLYVALTCPCAAQALMALKLKRLESVVGVTVLDPRPTVNAWRFGGHHEAFPGSEPDPLYGAKYLFELYQRSHRGYSGEITVPVLWDRLRAEIVNNEAADIVRMFDDGFGDLSDSTVQLYPSALRHEIAAVNEQLDDRFHNGFDRPGSATTPAAHEQDLLDQCESLGWLEARLGGAAYLVEGRLTEADLRAFVTLMRLDVACQGLGKTHQEPLRDYPSLLAYVRRLHALPGVAETVAPEHIKAGYDPIGASESAGLQQISRTG